MESGHPQQPYAIRFEQDLLTRGRNHCEGWRGDPRLTKSVNGQTDRGIALDAYENHQGSRRCGPSGVRALKSPEHRLELFAARRRLICFYPKVPHWFARRVLWLVDPPARLHRVRGRAVARPEIQKRRRTPATVARPIWESGHCQW